MTLKRSFFRECFLLALPLLFLGLTEVLAAEEGKGSAGDNEPVSISASKMVVQGLENKITFEGNVLIKRGDLKIKAGLAEVFFKEKEAGNPLKSSSSLLLEGAAQGGKEISRIVVSGDVDIRQGVRRAKAEKGRYDKEKERITLTGHPEAWENDYHVKGEMITFFLAENRTLVSESELVIRSESGELGLRPKK
ncbi:MAG: LptA/OstA family protein [Nitrospiria bacterium]